jgi:hypothetical protein
MCCFLVLSCSETHFLFGELTTAEEFTIEKEFTTPEMLEGTTGRGIPHGSEIFY